MNLHREITFEDDVCKHLAGRDWLYEAGSASHYDLARVLISAAVTGKIDVRGLVANSAKTADPAEAA